MLISFQKHWDEEMRRYSSCSQPIMKNVKGILKEFVINKLIKGSTIVTGIFDALFTTFNQLSISSQMIKTKVKATVFRMKSYVLD